MKLKTGCLHNYNGFTALFQALGLKVHLCFQLWWNPVAMERHYHHLVEGCRSVVYS